MSVPILAIHWPDPQREPDDGNRVVLDLRHEDFNSLAIIYRCVGDDPEADLAYPYYEMDALTALVFAHELATAAREALIHVSEHIQEINQ